MEIIINDIVEPELKQYLLRQDGITDVNLDYEKYFRKINIEMNEETNPDIVMKYIQLYEKYVNVNIVAFNKELKRKTKTLKYKFDDMCCEYCYMGLVMYLFKNDKVESVKSNMDFDIEPYNIEFIIEYDENYKEEDLIKYIEAEYDYNH